MTSAIYCIKNKLNQKLYIGSAVDVEHRWNHHRFQLKHKVHHSRYLQRAWNKYGEENFEFGIFEEVEDKTKLIEREQYYLDQYQSYKAKLGYNIRDNAASPLGSKCSKKVKKKLSDIRRRLWSTPAYREMMLKAHKGHKMPSYVGSKISASNKGKRKSEAHKEKIRAIVKAWWSDPDNRAARLKSLRKRERNKHE